MAGAIDRDSGKRETLTPCPGFCSTRRVQEVTDWIPLGSADPEVQSGRQLAAGLDLPYLQKKLTRGNSSMFSLKSVQPRSLMEEARGQRRLLTATPPEGVSHPLRRIEKSLLRTEYCTNGHETFTCYRIVGGRCLHKKWRYESRVPGSWLSVRVIRQALDPIAAL